jgi:hypothetical protein
MVLYEYFLIFESLHINTTSVKNAHAMSTFLFYILIN